MSTPDATVLVTTKNRCEDLRRALRSVLTQEGAVVEVLVIDDGSTDGTAEMVRSEFPSVRLERRQESKGLIVRRNEGARLAQAPVIFSIDDDAEFTAPDSVACTLADFDHPRIGAVAIPFVNVLQDPEILPRAHNVVSSQRWIADAYIGTAHAIRREIFIGLGGYREHFVHQGEEGDYCLRMLNAGYVVRVGRAKPIHHYESPVRSIARMDFYGRRNDVLFTLHNVPSSNLPFHLAGTLINGFRTAIKARHPLRQFAGLTAGFWQGTRRWAQGERRPVERGIYRLHRSLKKRGPLSLNELEDTLPPLSS